MEWLKRILEAQGLTADQIKVITEGVTTNYTGYVPPHRFEEVNAAKKKAEDDLKDRDKQLETLSKSAGDNAALTAQITKLQADNKASSEKYDADVKELRLGAAIKLALTGQAHDLDIVSSLLDKSKIELDESGAVKGGLDNQLKTLRESKAFLFAEKTETKPIFKGILPTDGKEKNGQAITSVGAAFATAANEVGKAPTTQINPWS